MRYPTPPERLHDHTVRAAWETARTNGTATGEHTGRRAEPVPLHPRGPPASAAATLADASWANRARTALPNGHCGLPRHQTCPHSNKCLACPVFITTAEDLPVHQAHRARTITLIHNLDTRGPHRAADDNRRVLTDLDRHITTHLPPANAAAEPPGTCGSAHADPPPVETRAEDAS